MQQRRLLPVSKEDYESLRIKSLAIHAHTNMFSIARTPSPSPACSVKVLFPSNLMSLSCSSSPTPDLGCSSPSGKDLVPLQHDYSFEIGSAGYRQQLML
jgi:hypothetical protein